MKKKKQSFWVQCVDIFKRYVILKNSKKQIDNALMRRVTFMEHTERDTVWWKYLMGYDVKTTSERL